MARIIQAMLCYVYKIFSKIIRHTARTDVEAKTTPFFFPEQVLERILERKELFVPSPSLIHYFPHGR